MVVEDKLLLLLGWLLAVADPGGVVLTVEMTWTTCVDVEVGVDKNVEVDTDLDAKCVVMKEVEGDERVGSGGAGERLRLVEVERVDNLRIETYDLVEVDDI